VFLEPKNVCLQMPSSQMTVTFIFPVGCTPTAQIRYFPELNVTFNSKGLSAFGIRLFMNHRCSPLAFCFLFAIYLFISSRV
jgi:hypothetical protein